MFDTDECFKLFDEAGIEMCLRPAYFHKMRVQVVGSYYEGYKLCKGRQIDEERISIDATNKDCCFKLHLQKDILNWNGIYDLELCLLRFAVEYNFVDCDIAPEDIAEVEIAGNQYPEFSDI